MPACRYGSRRSRWSSPYSLKRFWAKPRAINGASQLGGYNGMTGIPSFQIGDLVFMGYPFYYYVLITVLVCFLGCRMWVSSRHGQVILAIRKMVRTELFGYDIRARHSRSLSWPRSWPAFPGSFTCNGQYITAESGRPHPGRAASHLGRRRRARQSRACRDLPPELAELLVGSAATNTRSSSLARASRSPSSFSSRRGSS